MDDDTPVTVLHGTARHETTWGKLLAGSAPGLRLFLEWHEREFMLSLNTGPIVIEFPANDAH